MVGRSPAGASGEPQPTIAAVDVERARRRCLRAADARTRADGDPRAERRILQHRREGRRDVGGGRRPGRRRVEGTGVGGTTTGVGAVDGTVEPGVASDAGAVGPLSPQAASEPPGRGERGSGPRR